MPNGGYIRKYKEERPVVAICYDFDKTLSPDDMQAQGFIQAVGYEISKFWQESNGLAGSNDMDQNLAYMFKMMETAEGRVLFTKKALLEYGTKVRLFPGVEDWFRRIREYGEDHGVIVEHYIISSGLKEMIEGTPIASEFRKIYACSFLYDVDGIAYWPGVAVNYTNKTQFIFKINKGVESVSDCKLVNQYIEERERPVPFSRMIYVGDGTTDIPCMRLVKNFGGHSIAVYNPASAKVGRKDLASLIRDNRVNHVCAADYTEGSEIDRLVKLIIDKIAVDFELQQLEIPR